MIQILSPPARSEVKAIFDPSGENFGYISKGSPAAIRTGVPPEIGIV